ncbi:MAG: aminotransferase class V-fold PLP-dependent enzyme [Clostridia bacterium]|nr:aminotransferase class V-fold PLP-dependent enzyme [Clostridia bacterium]
MNTPICDFVAEYSRRNMIRGHMPGHKGVPVLGMENMDITEIQGADSLYEADGIIRESEENASALFGCPTFYSTEGSTQCIKAMVYLALQFAKRQGKKPLIAAGRNAHKAFVTAAALMDADVEWVFPKKNESYLSCCPTADETDAFLGAHRPCALYLTSPDYLGHMADIQAIAAVCKKHGVLFMVDNAHGAYLRFLESSLHPMDLGADLCCDSAHKTLPVLTGGAYLHLSDDMAKVFPRAQVKKAMSLFGSTSPSYLILQSLDKANELLANDLPERIRDAADSQSLFNGYFTEEAGHTLAGNEPLKITVKCKPSGYTGTELADLLRKENVECEFCDPDYLVLMRSVMGDFWRAMPWERVLLMLKKKPPIPDAPPMFSKPEKVLRIRDAVMAQSETIPAKDSLGRVLAGVTVGCPPAVPIVVSGERIDENALRCFAYYGISHVDVVKE